MLVLVVEAFADHLLAKGVVAVVTSPIQHAAWIGEFLERVLHRRLRRLAILRVSCLGRQRVQHPEKLLLGSEIRENPLLAVSLPDWRLRGSS